MKVQARADYDVIVIGAGCAGLSAAWHMLDAGLQDRRVLLLDPRTVYTNDRTWCFWDVEEHPFRHLAEAGWERWEVREAGGHPIVQGSERHGYRLVGAQRFYEATLERVYEGGYELALGEPVRAAIGRADGLVDVSTTRRTLRASLVLDTRWTQQNANPGTRAPRLSQHFVGHFVRAGAAVFDPGVATLMDFLPESGDVHFFYVLPFDERHALVESTGISRRVAPRAEHEARIAAYLAGRWPGAAFEVERREAGVIPMDVNPPIRRDEARIVPMGLRGGAARASTGYAFLGIQRQAAAVARALAKNRPVPPLAPQSARSAMLDAIFLSLARRRPATIPGLLVNLFRNAEPDRLVRFLSGCGSLVDDLHVVSKMKAMPMLREASSMVARA